MKKVITFIFFASLITAGISGQEQPSVTNTITLNIEDAVNMAIKNNISIKQSKLQLDMLERQNKYSWNSISPSISVGAGLSEGIPMPGTDVIKGSGIAFGDNSLSVSINGSVSMRFTPALFTTMKAAEIAYENGEISYETAIRAVELNVRQSFYSLLNMKESIESSQKTLDAAKRTYESNRTKYNRGYLDQITYLTSQYNYERQVPAVDSAKNTYQTNLDTFKQVLGIPLGDEVILNGSLDDVLSVHVSEDILHQNLDQIPAVKTILQNIKSTENSIQAAKYTAWGPSVSLSYSLSGSGSLRSNKSGSKTSGNSSSSIGVNVSIPLDGHFPWSNGTMSIENQKTNLENYKLQLENAKTTAMINIRNSYNSIVHAQNQLKIYESNLALMQKTYDMTLVAYNNGSKDLNTLQNAEDNLAAARFSIQTQKYSIITAVLNLENILGIPFGSLSSVVEAAE